MRSGGLFFYSMSYRKSVDSSYRTEVCCSVYLCRFFLEICRLACIVVSLDSEWVCLDRILKIRTVFPSEPTVSR